MADEIADLRGTLQEVVRENRLLREEIERLRRRVADLEAKLEQARRAGKRQAAPFSRNAPVQEPRRPGRRAGASHGEHARRPVPSRIDETVTAPLPASCPTCGDAITVTATVEQIQEDAPVVAPTVTRFVIEVGRCRGCGRRIQGRHPRQTSDAVGAAGVQLGPRAVALATSLHHEAGLSYGKVATVLAETTGVSAAPSTLVRAVQRIGDRCEDIDIALCDEVSSAPVVTPDETGWRVNGGSAWLWTFATEQTTVYSVAPSRGGEVIREMLGEDYAGVVVRDGWAPYRQLTKADHQTCLAHLLRRCTELIDDSRGRGREIPRAVKRLLQDALDVRDRRDAGELDPAAVTVAVVDLEARLEALLARPAIRHRGNRRLLDHLRTERAALFTFLRRADVPATNWRAEQAIRPAVVNRKTWGGNRTWSGARAQEILMGVLRTCRQRHVDSTAVLVAALRAPSRSSPPLKLLAPA